MWRRRGGADSADRMLTRVSWRAPWSTQFNRTAKRADFRASIVRAVIGVDLAPGEIAAGPIRVRNWTAPLKAHAVCPNIGPSADDEAVADARI